MTDRELEALREQHLNELELLAAQNNPDDDCVARMVYLRQVIDGIELSLRYGRR